MALFVDIEKSLGAFRLRVRFETGHAILALLGASGSGKSVTLQCIAGIETPDRGQIVLGDRVLFDSELHINLPPQKRRVGYLFQSYALFPNMTVLDNVAAAYAEGSRAERRARAREELVRFRLEHLAGQRPAALSGGEQQRTALARCLAAKPEVLLLDEPFSALDDYLKWQLELELMDLLESYAGDAILVSHSRDEVCRLAKQVCILSGGRSEPVLSVEQMMHAPGSVAAALLSGCKNVSPLRLREDGLLWAENWGVALRLAGAPGGADHIGIRAHDIRLQGGENPVPATLTRVIDNVFSNVPMFRTPGGGLLRAEQDKSAPLPAPGSEVELSLPAAALLLLKEGREP